jgi:hypothetical protein
MKILRNMIHDLMMVMIPKSLRKNMLTCQQVAHIIAEKQDITKFKKVKLQMHLFICQSCLDYKNQIKIIDSSIKELREINLTSYQKEQISNSKSKIINKYSKD